MITRWYYNQPMITNNLTCEASLNNWKMIINNNKSANAVKNVKLLKNKKLESGAEYRFWKNQTFIAEIILTLITQTSV